MIASCKANEANLSDEIPATISPAHIRELIGGWLIQRSDAGIWRQAANIKMLSAIQLLLVTTYRLSDESLSLCRDLGVAVWGIPELIYLICKHSPDSVFPCHPSSTFDADGMSNWIDSSGNTRLSAS